MTAQIIDGNALAARLRAGLAQRVQGLAARGTRPGLAVLLVGEDPASQVYVRNKIKACEQAGLHAVFEKYDADLDQAALLARIESLNRDPFVHGILVQMPLPRHIDSHRVIDAIAPAKDVDGFSVLSAGALMAGLPGLRPCTPAGCMALIASTGLDLRGKHAVVVGRSNTVGKPMALLLLQAHATVTICHSATVDLARHAREADVVVMAVGRRNTLTAEMVKPGAIVIDVGTNRNDDGKLCGDVDFDAVRQVAGAITPVPGGVGPMTITMLLVNTVEAAERSANLQEVPPAMNPLLDFSGLPRFDAIAPEHVAPALDRLLADADAALLKATGDSVPADYEALSAVLDVATERLGRAWGTIGHLNAVADTPALRAAYTDNLARVTDFHSRLGADDRLYAKYKAVLADPSSARLTPARRKALDNALRDFVLSGAELEGAAKQRFAELQEAQAEAARLFAEHVLDATDGFSLFVDSARLAGVPEDAQAAARAAAQADGRDGFKLTLHQPSYFPVMQYASDRALRETLYTAYTTRASELGRPEHDNTPVIAQLLALRQEEAGLLGHASFAEVSLVPKMAQSAQQVTDFLRDLAQRAREGAQRDLAELRAFARSELGLPELQAWDIAYASEKLKERRYAFSETEVKQYFTEPKVLEGLFRIVETLFEVRISPDVAPVWHPRVRFFRIERPSGAGDTPGQLIGQFYLDPYARSGKRPGAWMDDVRVRWQRPEGSLQTPVAHLVCNFAPPLPGRPALLTHDDVTTLFHEFGHGLHHMLTQVDDIGVSGISGVEWDAVELPSQFMENFCWEWDVVKRLTAHADTGAALPRALFDKMLAAKNFQTGLATLRQVELSLVDMRLHAEPDSHTRVAQVLAEVRAEVAVIQAPAFNRFLHSFSHIFAGGYSAGYYSYKWAEVLSADAWSAFEEAAQGGSVLDVEVGRRYRQNVLEAGGSRSALDSFKAFRGREPRIDALLRHQGLA